MKPRILIIYTGGTIGMIEDADTKVLKPFDFTHLMENVPKVKMLDYEIDNIQFHPPIDSSDMSIGHWQQIASAIADNYLGYDGFVAPTVPIQWHILHRLSRSCSITCTSR